MEIPGKATNKEIMRATKMNFGNFSIISWKEFSHLSKFSQFSLAKAQMVPT